MAVSGRYGNTSHAPYVDAFVLIPSIGLRGNVSFLLDTGADCTVLAEVDARRLGMDYAALAHPMRSFGIGGASNDFQEPAVLGIADGPALHLFAISLIVKSPDPNLITMPSLLGRDVINRMRITLEHAANNCHIEIVNSDAIVR
jgi:hypothetical protein